ncbi:hypothetical protein ACNSTQ_20765 [Alkalihalobacterium sp. APHAB7]
MFKAPLSRRLPLFVCLAADAIGSRSLRSNKRVQREDTFVGPPALVAAKQASSAFHVRMYIESVHISLAPATRIR